MRKESDLLFHISPLGNLKILKPLTIQDGKKVLCATDSYAFALYMLAKKTKEYPNGNFHCCLVKDKLYIYEKWENATYNIFNDKIGYLYFIKKDGSIFNEQVPQYEFDSPVKVIKCVRIKNIYNEIKKLIKSGSIIIRNYADYKG